ncbi:hypothetical protein Hanom_Chr04g00372501 [Helianthus anomalus]
MIRKYYLEKRKGILFPASWQMTVKVSTKKPNFLLDQCQFCHIDAAPLKRLHDINCFLNQQIQMIRNRFRFIPRRIRTEIEWPRKHRPAVTLLTKKDHD